MKKHISILLIVAVALTIVTFSCKKKSEPATPKKTYAELIVGRWKTSAEQPYFEVYYANGTGKMWDTADDVQEDEADTFTWTIDSDNKLMQNITFQSGAGTIVQYCNIITLNETTFKYNNDGWRAEYTLTRVN